MTDKGKSRTPHIYGGRVVKISTSVASLAAARFNFHLSHFVEQCKDEPKEVIEKLKGGHAYFDARPVILSDEGELLVISEAGLIFLFNLFFWNKENILWRMADIRRNSVTILCRTHLSHKSIDGLSIERVI